MVCDISIFKSHLTPWSSIYLILQVVVFLRIVYLSDLLLLIYTMIYLRLYIF